MFDKNYKPDILNCMANLSNDEVFTSPQLTNQILDMLPKELFESTETTFLDPCCKTGVFLREITKRLLRAQIPDYEQKLAKLNKDRDAIRDIWNEGNDGHKEVDIDDFLETEAPDSAAFLKDLQTKLDHILTKQVFGIAITELTALMSRRTLYCSKDANAQYSIVEGDFGKDTRPSKLPNGTIIENLCNEGNIIYDKLDHKWKETKSKITDAEIKEAKENGEELEIFKENDVKYKISRTCEYCGANGKVLKRNEELESYAYPFIHLTVEEIKRRLNMGNFHIDVVAMNAPYQLNDGGGTGDSAKPIYNKFIEKAQELNPKYIVSINPSRWMKGGKGLDKFRLNMINDTHVKEIYDFEDASECFPNVHIDGGINYFLWDRNYNGKTHYVYKTANGEVVESDRFLKTDDSGIVIRDYRQLSIIEKVKSVSKTFMPTLVSARNPYGFCADLFNSPERYPNADLSDIVKPDYIKIFGVKGIKGGAKRVVGYVKPESIEKNNENIKKYKLLFSKAYSADATVPPEIILCKPGEICTETFLQIGCFDTEIEAKNCLAYIKTRFFRALLQFGRAGMNNSQKSFEYVPVQDFTKTWTDKDLYTKYKLTQDEIDFIESNIQEMK